MAKTISQAQADALSSGFFDSLGSDEEVFKPKHSLSKLYQLAGELAEEAQSNLNKSDRVASGALSQSITIEDPVMSAKEVRIDVSMLFYWKFINDGVKGVISGQPNSKFSFKNLFVSKKMMRQIRKWVIKEGLKTKAKGQGKPITKRERKRKSITDTSNSTAYSIARSVKAKGLKKTNFFTKALNTIKQKAKEDLGKSFAADIVEAIPKKI